MSKDPYHAVQQDIQSSMPTASTLRSSYLRIRSMAREGSEELAWARSELETTLSTLEADLEALEESVQIVESTGPRMFGLDEVEMDERRKYVRRIRREIEDMRAEVDGKIPPSHPKSPFSPPLPVSSPAPGYRSNPQSPRGESSRPSRDEDDDHQGNWAREEQQLMMQEQDRTMETISGTLTTLAQQAGLIGQEVSEHNEMLEDLEQGVDQTDSKLSGAMRKMRKFIRHTEETKSGWCVTILTIVLLILLLAVILV